MMRKKTKMAWSASSSPQWQLDCLQDVEVMEERKVRVEVLQQVLQRQNLLPVTRQIPVTGPTYKIATVRCGPIPGRPISCMKASWKEIEDKMNINIDWQVYYNSDWSEQKFLLLASGDLPDAFLPNA